MSINKHGFNMVYILLVISLTSKPIKFQHFYQPMIYAVVYLLITLIYQFSSGRLIYSFLDWETNTAKSFLLCAIFVFICAPLTHLFVFGIYKLKKCVINKMKEAYCKKLPDVEKCSPIKSKHENERKSTDEHELLNTNNNSPLP